MQCCAVSNRRERVPPAPPVSTPEAILPYYGVAPLNSAHTESLILSLAGRGDTPSRFFSFDLTTTNQQYMFYAYPVEYGLAVFADRDNGMEGGWDGALMSSDQMGPDTVNVTVAGRGSVPFYLYRSEWPWNGTSRWRVK